MTAGLQWIRARMTRARWLLVVAAASVPVLLVGILLVGILADAPRAAAAIALLLLALALLGGAIGAFLVVRRYRRVRAALDGESMAVGEPSRAVVDADPLVAGWPRARRIAAGRALGLSADAVAAFGLATRSPFAREQLAGLATSWRLTWRDLVALATSGAGPAAFALALGRTDATALLLLARTVATADEEGAVVADALARHVAGSPEVAGLPLSVRHWLIERLVVAGDLPAAARLLGRAPRSTHGQLLALDVLNPFVEGALEESPAPWLAALSALYRRAGLEGVVLQNRPGSPLDLLRGEPVAPLGDDGPFVSVIMTTHRPDPVALATAVDTVLAQSWTNWELLLVDDASPSDFDAVLDAAAARDPRIRLVRASANAGTYVRRNEALLAARGEFATMHDSDDWMHPRRLEAQVRHLTARPGLLANVCRSARVTPEVRFAQPRGALLRLTESSLLFRRTEVLDRIGFFDSVRKGADTGFRRRLEAVTGRPVPIVDLEAPLILSRFEEGSLSGGELRDGWTHPARVAASSAHAHWVDAERAAGRTPRLDFPLASRPYPVPTVLLGEPEPPAEVDVLFLVDVRDDRRRAARHRRIDAALRDAVAAGLRVGLRRLDAPVPPGLSPRPRSAVQGLVNDGRVVEVLPGREVAARVVAVPEAEVLLGAPPCPDGLSAAEVLIAETSAALRDEVLAGASRLISGAVAAVVSPPEVLRAAATPAR